MVIQFKDLATANLIQNEIYLGGTEGNQKDEVLSKLFNVGNAGGFRYRGSTPDGLSLLILYSSSEHSLWKDGFDANGNYVYYGDNKSYLQDATETRKKGNLILEKIFEYAYEGKKDLVPPIFIVEKVKGRDVKIVGLAVPGAKSLKQSEALQLVEQVDEDGNVFENYKAHFTILNDLLVKREWLTDIEAGKSRNSKYTPLNWLNWIEDKAYEEITKFPKRNQSEMSVDEKQKSAEIIAYSIARFGENFCEDLIYKNLQGIWIFVKNYLDFPKSRFIKTVANYEELLSDQHTKNMKNAPRYIYSVLTEYDGMNRLALTESVNKLIHNIIENRHDREAKVILNQEVSDSIKPEYTIATTGKMAEELFYEWYNAGEIAELKKYQQIKLEDTRLTNKGYDFAMNGMPSYLFEVKGLRAATGSVRFTQNEWEKAKEYKDRYFLVFIYNLDKEAKYKIVRNPFDTLQTTTQEMYVKQVNWHVQSVDIIKSVEDDY